MSVCYPILYLSIIIQNKILKCDSNSGYLNSQSSWAVFLSIYLLCLIHALFLTTKIFYTDISISYPPPFYISPELDMQLPNIVFESMLVR